MSDVAVRALVAVAAVSIVIWVAFWGNRRERHAAVAAPLQLDGIEARVLFFTDVACRRCDLVRARLESLGTVFAEIAYNHEPDLHRTIGVTGVPLLVVRDGAGVVVDRVAGLASARRLRRALAHLG